jgi:hypothetical protein
MYAPTTPIHACSAIRARPPVPTRLPVPASNDLSQIPAHLSLPLPLSLSCRQPTSLSPGSLYVIGSTYCKTNINVLVAYTQ